jgi:hypothetical protein
MPVPMLTQKSFRNAKKFIEDNARPLEAARFQFHFESGSLTSIISKLSEYQNQDGGFGHALEPDLRAPESSVLCTSVAFQVFREIRVERNTNLVGKAIDYLLETLDKEKLHWRIIPAQVESSPHAPWWDQAGATNNFDSFSLNPTAEILGYLYEFGQGVPKDILGSISQRVISYLEESGEIKMHEFLCCLRLLETKDIPESLGQKVYHRLMVFIPQLVEKDPIGWEGYNLKPLQVVDSPTSPFMNDLENAVEENLAYEISSQNVDGSWSPNWTWGGVFPDDWERARMEWSGVITLQKLLVLKRFGRIEEG